MILYFLFILTPADHSDAMPPTSPEDIKPRTLKYESVQITPVHLKEMEAVCARPSPLRLTLTTVQWDVSTFDQMRLILKNGKARLSMQFHGCELYQQGLAQGKKLEDDEKIDLDCLRVSVNDFEYYVLYFKLVRSVQALTLFMEGRSPWRVHNDPMWTYKAFPTKTLTLHDGILNDHDAETLGEAIAEAGHLETLEIHKTALSEHAFEILTEKVPLTLKRFSYTPSQKDETAEELSVVSFLSRHKGLTDLTVSSMPLALFKNPLHKMPLQRLCLRKMIYGNGRAKKDPLLVITRAHAATLTHLEVIHQQSYKRWKMFFKCLKNLENLRTLSLAYSRAFYLPPRFWPLHELLSNLPSQLHTLDLSATRFYKSDCQSVAAHSRENPALMILDDNTLCE